MNKPRRRIAVVRPIPLETLHRVVGGTDEVVLTVDGDTFKQPFARGGWGDGTPGTP